VPLHECLFVYFSFLLISFLGDGSTCFQLTFWSSLSLLVKHDDIIIWVGVNLLPLKQQWESWDSPWPSVTSTLDNECWGIKRTVKPLLRSGFLLKRCHVYHFFKTRYQQGFYRDSWSCLLKRTLLSAYALASWGEWAVGKPRLVYLLCKIKASFTCQ